MAALPEVQAAIGKSQGQQGKNGYDLTDEQVTALCAEAAGAATTILYEASGRLFTGRCGPVTVRPVARPTDVDSRVWTGGGGAWGWSASWGSCAAGLGAGAGVVSHFGCSNPPEVDLGAYPVNTIELVLIDGVVIPPDEYELRDHRTLVRMRPTASATPTQRWGWPTCQIEDLPDTQVGTFSVTYTYGQDPGEGGRLAAKRLAEFIVLPSFGDTSKYPRRATQVARQGVSVTAVDAVELVKSGQSGIYEVDLWLAAVNPTKASRQSVVWSPDLGRARRTATPSPRR